MRRSIGIMALGLLAIVDLGQVTGPALAVMETPPAPRTPPAAKPARPIPAQEPTGRAVRLDIPVSWQLTRARMGAGGSTTLTESFRETWTLELRPGGYLFLQSPRARVPAYRPAQSDQAGALPSMVLIGEQDFAELVGIKPLPTAEDAEGEDAATQQTPADEALTTPVTLHLTKAVKGGSDVTLAWSEEEHYAIHFDVGTTLY